MNTLIRILALATHPVEVASTRYRVLAYVPALERSGMEVTFSPFFSSLVLSRLSRPGGPLEKLYYILKGTVVRAVRLGSSRFDLVFVHREIFPLGRNVFLSLLKKRTRKIIYDYDDAMFLPQRQDRPLLRKLEKPEGTRELISGSDAVVAGNSFLKEYAQQYNARVSLIPTAIDLSKLPPPVYGLDRGPCVIGWIGSHTTEKYIHSLRGVFESLSDLCRYELKVVGARQSLLLNGANVVQLPWSLDREAEDFRSCDIGVYPLWDDEWARGKCGFKAIQFMAAGVPVVTSAVGANKEIIRDGVNGFLVASEAEWRDRLLLLIKNPELRWEIGRAGRKTVEEGYCTGVTTPKLLGVIRSILGEIG